MPWRFLDAGSLSVRNVSLLPAFQKPTHMQTYLRLKLTWTGAYDPIETALGDIT